LAKKHLRKAMFSFARVLLAGIMAIPLFIFIPLSAKVGLGWLMIVMLILIIGLMTWEVLTFFENITKW